MIESLPVEGHVKIARVKGGRQPFTVQNFVAVVGVAQGHFSNEVVIHVELLSVLSVEVPNEARRVYQRGAATEERSEELE